MRKNGPTKVKGEIARLAEDVRALGPKNSAEAYQVAMNILAQGLPEVSAEDIFTSERSTWRDADELVRKVVAILFPPPQPGNPTNQK